MFDRLRRKIGEFTGFAHTFDATDYRVAAAALMVHVATADGVVSTAERERLVHLMETRYALTHDDAVALIAAGNSVDRSSSDLTDFTEVLGRVLDLEGRKSMLEMLWETALCDGAVHEFEEALVMRAAALLGLSPDEAVAERERAIAKPSATPEDKAAR